MPIRYTVDIDIDLPRDKVVELMDSPESLPKWLRGLELFEPIAGEPGQVGSTSKFVVKSGSRSIEMVETITKRDLPDEFNCTYDTKGVHNIVNNRFVEKGPNQTQWISENEFQLGGFMKIIGFFFKGAFPKQSLAHMKDFKAFAEEGKDVRES